MKRLLAILITPALLVIASSGAATQLYMSKLPLSNPYRCLNCHTVQDPVLANATLNSFGLDFKNNGFKWDRTLAQKGSDGDSCSNGFEIGDQDGDGRLDLNLTGERHNPGEMDCTLQLTPEAWPTLKPRLDRRFRSGRAAKPPKMFPNTRLLREMLSRLSYATSLPFPVLLLISGVFVGIVGVLIGLVLFFNLQCALAFIGTPGLYAPGFELEGTAGRALVQGLGILFVMWNIPYLVAVWHPRKQRTALFEAIAMQATGLVGESLLLAGLPAGHPALQATATRFILFDASGLLLLCLAAWITGRQAAQ